MHWGKEDNWRVGFIEDYNETTGKHRMKFDIDATGFTPVFLALFPTSINEVKRKYSTICDFSSVPSLMKYSWRMLLANYCVLKYPSFP